MIIREKSSTPKVAITADCMACPIALQKFIEVRGYGAEWEVIRMEPIQTHGFRLDDSGVIS